MSILDELIESCVGNVSYRGRELLVRGMTGKERDSYSVAASERQGDIASMMAMRRELCAACLLDPQTKAPMANGDASEYADRLPADLIYAMWDEIERLSGIEHSAVEEAEGNFSRGQTEHSLSE